MSLLLEARREDGSSTRLPLAAEAVQHLGSAASAEIRYLDEPYLSEFQAELELREGTLSVRQSPQATNPLFFQGHENPIVHLHPGECFVIGHTRFFLTEVPDPAAGPLVEAPEARLRLMNLLELPEIFRLRSARESLAHVATLLRLVCEARWVEIRGPGGVLARDAAEDNLLMPPPDPGLLEKALGESPRPQVQVFPGGAWAMACQLTAPGEGNLLFIVQGQGATEASLQEKARFTGLIADTAARNLGLKRLEDFKQKLERYFSGKVVSKILDSADPAELEPRLARASILFFDIRGFSRLSEQGSQQALAGVQELRRVMTAMTEEIFSENGTVIQYMGDGLLACWGLPYPDERAEEHACQAALKMLARLEATAPQWRCGIGIHAGDVVAGSLGSEQVFSYNVMGTVVNQASRVEGITKLVEAPILVTEEVAKHVEGSQKRRVGRFQPAGMDTALELYQLLPPGTKAGDMEPGLAAFERGDWDVAYHQLDALPAKDLPARYLKALAEMHRRKPPKDWRGVIELEGK
jgi:adenylate cyclase